MRLFFCGDVSKFVYVMNDSTSIPIACSLPEASQAARETALAATLFAHRLQTRELADGYAFQFPNDAALLAQLLEFIAFERQCCPFFLFELAFEPQQGPLWLRMRGGEGVKEFLSSWSTTL
jgi:hypothetical protein